MAAELVSSTLQQRSSRPLYKQIQSDILKCLAAGEWKAGQQLPTEPELAKRFGVAIYTVRAGIGDLVIAGILARRQGKGTFVTRHEREHARQVFAKIFDSDKRKVIPTGQKVMFFRKQVADERTRTLLRLDRRKKSHVYFWEVVVEVEERAICV